MTPTACIVSPGGDLDERTAAVLARAEAADGNGADAFAAVFEATLAAGSLDAAAVLPFVRRLWFTPWRLDRGERVRAREAAWLRGTRRLRLDAAGRDVAAFEAGQGPTVLLVHGWGDSAARLGAFIEPLSSRGMRVLGIDLPGHGETGGDLSDLYEFLDVLDAVIRDQHVEAVVAHSLGAQAVVKALRRVPGVRAAAVVAPPVSLDRSVTTFATLFALPDAAVKALRDDITARFGVGVWAEWDVRNDGPHLGGVPALVVHSSDDDQVEPADIRSLASCWPNAQLRTWQGLGHTRLLRDPAVVSEIADFIQAQVPTPVNTVVA